MLTCVSLFSCCLFVLLSAPRCNYVCVHLFSPVCLSAYCLYPSPLEPVVQEVGAKRTSVLTPLMPISLRTPVLPKTHCIRAPGRLHTGPEYSRFWRLGMEPRLCLNALRKAFTNPSSQAHIVWILP